jgi:hypothetical protein
MLDFNGFPHEDLLHSICSNVPTLLRVYLGVPLKLVRQEGHTPLYPGSLETAGVSSSGHLQISNLCLIDGVIASVHCTTFLGHAQLMP